MKSSTILMIAGALCVVIAILGQVGPFQDRLEDISAVTLIIGLALGFGGITMASKEKKNSGGSRIEPRRED